MSTDEMNMAAAQSVGWTRRTVTARQSAFFGVSMGTEAWFPPDNREWEDLEVPRFHESLDAVAELIKTLSSVEFLEGPFYLSEQGKFNVELERIVQRDLAGTKQEKFYFDIINATAIQRLEAYLITKGLWIVKE